MRKLILSVVCLLALIGIWYGVWSWQMAADVARVKASIDYQNQQFKTVKRDVVFKADSVSASGFPFHSRVKVTRPTLSMIDMRETYAVSFETVELEPVDAAQGRYRVTLPATFDALYAEDGAAPEHYRVTMSEVPKLLLRAQGDSTHCSDLPGTARCVDVAADAPIISYAASLPRSLILHMELNGDSRDAQFNLLSLGVPVFEPIPASVGGPLSLLVGVFRQALVFHTK